MEGIHILIRRLHDLCLWQFRTSQIHDIVKGQGNCRCTGCVLYASLYSMLAHAVGSGVGKDVAYRDNGI